MRRHPDPLGRLTWKRVVMPRKWRIQLLEPESGFRWVTPFANLRLLNLIVGLFANLFASRGLMKNLSLQFDCCFLLIRPRMRKELKLLLIKLVQMLVFVMSDQSLLVFQCKKTGFDGHRSY